METSRQCEFDFRPVIVVKLYINGGIVHECVWDVRETVYDLDIERFRTAAQKLLKELNDRFDKDHDRPLMAQEPFIERPPLPDGWDKFSLTKEEQELMRIT